MGDGLGLLKTLKIEQPQEPATHSWELPQRTESWVWSRPLHPHVHGSILHKR